MAELPIHDGHHGWEQLHHGGLEPALAEGLGHLEADETAPHHHRRARFPRLEEPVEPVHVRHVPEPEDVLGRDAGEAGHDGVSPLREDELVVR